MPFKKIYVAGAITPYPLENPVLGFLGNIKRGQRMAVKLILGGFFPFCPFLDYQLFLQLQEGENITEKMIKDLSMAWLDVSDAVLVLPKYRKSVGTKLEIARAKELNIPVFYSIEDMIDAEEENNE